MNDSTKRKEEGLLKKKKSPIIAGAIGEVDAPGDLEKQLGEMTKYWSEAVSELREEEFDSIESAVDRIVELAASKLGVVAEGRATQDFMKEALLVSDDVIETLKSTLTIKK